MKGFLVNANSSGVAYVSFREGSIGFSSDLTLACYVNFCDSNFPGENTKGQRDLQNADSQIHIIFIDNISLIKPSL